MKRPAAIAAVLLFARLAVAAPQSSAQSSAAAKSDGENYKITVHSNLVFLPTRVQDKKGGTIYGLKPEQFIVEDNGVRRKVQIDEDPESAGLSLVVALQCSRSAEVEFAKLKGLGAMIDGIVGDAPHEVSIVSYGAGPYVLGEFSGRSDATRRALSRLKPCQDYNAATIDTVYYAVNMLKRRPNHYRRAVLLIGETRDHGSRSSLHEVAAELGVTDTVIYAVAFSPTRDEALRDLRYGDHPPPVPVFSPPPSSPGNQASPGDADSAAPVQTVYKQKTPLFAWPPQFLLIVNALKGNAASELAALSGGEYVNFTTQRGFEDSLQRIANQIHNYYMLSFQPESDQALALHSLRVRIAGYPDAVIQTRRSYWSGILEPSSGNVQ
jgi:VWFA-related protein